jgi:DNA replication protein DnaC
LGKGECPTLEKAREARILVIDDLGLERDHGPILDVLHERNQQNRVTWVTSGLTIEQIRERYGEAVYRRLVEMNGTAGRVVSCFGKAASNVAQVAR